MLTLVTRVAAANHRVQQPADGGAAARRENRGRPGPHGALGLLAGENRIFHMGSTVIFHQTFGPRTDTSMYQRLCTSASDTEGLAATCSS